MLHDENGRPLDAEVDYDTDGFPYFSSGTYLDGSNEPCNEDVLDYLNEYERDYLDEQAFDHYLERTEFNRYNYQD